MQKPMLDGWADGMVDCKVSEFCSIYSREHLRNTIGRWLAHPFSSISSLCHVFRCLNKDRVFATILSLEPKL